MNLSLAADFWLRVGSGNCRIGRWVTTTRGIIIRL